METIVDYFSAMPKAHRSAVLIGGLAFFFFIEGAAPLFRLKYNRWKHAGLNIFFTLTTVLVNLSMAFLLVKSSAWVTENEFGLIQWIPMGLVLQGIVGLLLLDLIGAWLAHYVEHRVSWMWEIPCHSPYRPTR